MDPRYQVSGNSGVSDYLVGKRERSRSPSVDDYNRPNWCPLSPEGKCQLGCGHAYRLSLQRESATPVDPPAAPRRPRRLSVPVDPSQPAIPRRERLKEAPKYSGKSEIENYLRQFEIVATLNNWNYAQSGMELATSLTEEAQEVLATLPGEWTTDFDTLCDALLQRFSPEGREGGYTIELLSRTCRKSENVVEYGHALKRLARRAYPGGLQEKLLVDLYIKGLPSREFKRYVHLAQPHTMEAAMDLARGFQAFEAQSELERGTKKPPKEEAASRAVETAGASPDDKPASQNINQNQHKNGDKGRKYPPLSKTLGDILQSIEKQAT